MQRRFLVSLVNVRPCVRPARLFVARGRPSLHFETSIKPEINNSERLHPCRKQMDAGGWRGSVPGAACGCHLLLGVCLSNPSAYTALFQIWGTCSVANAVFNKWVHGTASAKSISSRGNRPLKPVIWGLLKFCGHPDLWHPFNQITNTWLSPATYICNNLQLSHDKHQYHQTIWFYREQREESSLSVV